MAIAFSDMNHKFGDKIKCPVCNKKFTFGDQSKYIASGDYVCSWNCFLKVVNRKGDKE